MAENSAIGWTDHTFNPWVGCTKVSPACDNCYAESWSRQAGRPHLWNGKRERTKTWRDPLKWNKAAEGAARRPRVFCASLADVFDNQVPDEWREDLWQLIADTQNLDWLLLTKRPQNIAKMLPDNYAPGVDKDEWPWSNVWLGTTVENQEEADRRIPHLLSVPARVHFLSCEPLLGPINITRWLHDSNCMSLATGDVEDCTCHEPREICVNWVISGGESGPHRRDTAIEWHNDLRLQCDIAGVPYHFKQDSALRPGKRGRASDDLWACKQFPEAACS